MLAPLVDFRYLVEVVGGAFMSRPDTVVIPAVKKILAIELIITPVIEYLLEEKRQATS
jgi:phosphoribulokinase